MHSLLLYFVQNIICVKGPEFFLRTPVTATRTGDEFYVGNNGEANQSKYPIELRARLTRQNL